jgi:hypothetical protein
MGILDKVKDVTGVGLNAEEQYRRAYEKGVFLQPPNYAEASKQFTAAAEKFRKAGSIDRARRAEANAILYQLVHARDLSHIEALLNGLDGVPEIEKIASQTEMMSGLTFIYELKALRWEIFAESCRELVAKADAYRQAAESAMKLGTAPLALAEWVPLHGPTDKGLMRGFYYAALADYHSAFAMIPDSPEDAQNSLHKAAVGFRQAQVQDWADQTAIHIDALQARRHCWMCGREMQGRDHYFRYYPAATTRYHGKIVEDRKEDAGMLDRSNLVTLCTVCGSAVEAQADRYALSRAAELREWVAPLLESHSRQIQELTNRLSRVEART